MDGTLLRGYAVEWNLGSPSQALRCLVSLEFQDVPTMLAGS